MQESFNEGSCRPERLAELRAQYATLTQVCDHTHEQLLADHERFIEQAETLNAE